MYYVQHLKYITKNYMIKSDRNVELGQKPLSSYWECIELVLHMSSYVNLAQIASYSEASSQDMGHDNKILLTLAYKIHLFSVPQVHLCCEWNCDKMDCRIHPVTHSHMARTEPSSFTFSSLFSFSFIWSLGNPEFLYWHSIRFWVKLQMSYWQLLLFGEMPFWHKNGYFLW